MRTYATLYGLAQVTADLRPPLALNVDSPATLSVVNNQYSPNPFTVVATVLNNGTATATNVQLTLNLPAGLSLVNGSLTQSIGDLPVGQEQQLVWTVQASPQQNQTTLTMSVTATASNADTKQVSRTLTVPPLTLPTGPQPPRHTTSYYIQSDDLNQAIQLGCDARARGEIGIVVLDFGSPRSWIDDSRPTRHPVTTYGAKLVYLDTTLDVDRIQSLVLGFAMGYAEPYSEWYNYTCAGLPSDPTSLTGANLTIAVGVSNSAIRDTKNKRWFDNQDLTFDHGVAWANMTNSIHSLFTRPLPFRGRAIKLYPRVGVAGGYDAEYYQSEIADHRDPDTGSRAASLDADKWTIYTDAVQPKLFTKAWAEGYNTREQQTQRHRRYYYFGSCEDCPRRGDPNTWSPLKDDGQRQATPESQIFDRVYHLTWELDAAYPLPQIYKAPYPNQWYNVRWYVNTIHERNMTFAGVMTECGVPGCPSDTRVRLSQFNCGNGTACAGDWAKYNCTADPCLEFLPSPGWQALSDTISASVTPYGVPNTDILPQSVLNWVTDISFQP